MSPEKACEILNNARFMMSIWVLGHLKDAGLANYVQGYGAYRSNVVNAYGAIAIAEKLAKDEPQVMFGSLYKEPVIRKPPTYDGPPPPEGYLSDPVGSKDAKEGS